MSRKKNLFTRRDVLRYAGASGVAMVGSKALGQVCVDGTFIPSIATDAFTGCGVGGEPFPASPFILQPYQQELPILSALRPGWRDPDGNLVPGSGVYSSSGNYPAGPGRCGSRCSSGPASCRRARRRASRTPWGTAPGTTPWPIRSGASPTPARTSSGRAGPA